MTAVISNHIRTYQRPYVHARTTANYDHNNYWTPVSWFMFYGVVSSIRNTFLKCIKYIVTYKKYLRHSKD